MARAALREWIETLRRGLWLTPERLRVYPRLLVVCLVVAIGGLIATRHGNLDPWERPLGVDFSGVWTAGTEVDAGHPSQPYDNAAHARAQAAAFSPARSFLPWAYPPIALPIAAALARLPYLAALAVWQGLTLLLYLVAIGRVLAGTGLRRSDVAIAPLAFPAVAVNLLHGQNGCLSAGLLALGATLVPRRPLVAGLILGLTGFKPHLALAAPFALLAGGRWRTALVAFATLVILSGATVLAYGLEPWFAFARSLGFSRTVILEGGGLEPYKLQSVFAGVRLLGGPVALAYGVQALAAGLALLTLCFVWRRDSDDRLKLAALLVASLSLTPYVLDYDLTLLGPALAALVARGLDRGFVPYEKTLLAVAWAMPLAARGVAMSLHVPLAQLVTLGLLALIGSKAMRPNPAMVAASMPTPGVISAQSR